MHFFSLLMTGLRVNVSWTEELLLCKHW